MLASNLSMCMNIRWYLLVYGRGSDWSGGDSYPALFNREVPPMTSLRSDLRALCTWSGCSSFLIYKQRFPGRAEISILYMQGFPVPCRDSRSSYDQAYHDETLR